jgi:hypothetical protein
MKAILSMELVLGIGGSAGAADDKVVDPVGTWKCEYEIGGQPRTSTLKIKKDGDNLVGTMSWPDQEGTKLKDLKLKDGTLTFSAERKLAGMDGGITTAFQFPVGQAQSLAARPEESRRFLSRHGVLGGEQDLGLGLRESN